MSYRSRVPSLALHKKVSRYLTETESIPRWKLILLAVGLVFFMQVVHESDIFSDSDSIIQTDQ